MHYFTTFVTGSSRKPIRVGDQKVCSVLLLQMLNSSEFFSFQIRSFDKFLLPTRQFNAEVSK